MKFVVAGGGFAGLAAGLAVARAGHQAVVLERDLVGQHDAPEAFTVARRGIPHFFQPHAFLPRGLRELEAARDRKSTRLNSSHVRISYAVFCFKKSELPWSGPPRNRTSSRGDSASTLQGCFMETAAVFQVRGCFFLKQSGDPKIRPPSPTRRPAA